MISNRMMASVDQVCNVRALIQLGAWARCMSYGQHSLSGNHKEVLWNTSNRATRLRIRRSLTLAHMRIVLELLFAIRVHIL